MYNRVNSKKLILCAFMIYDMNYKFRRKKLLSGMIVTMCLPVVSIITEVCLNSRIVYPRLIPRLYIVASSACHISLNLLSNSEHILAKGPVHSLSNQCLRLGTYRHAYKHTHTHTHIEMVFWGLWVRVRLGGQIFSFES